jgi:hypothetical protein
LSKEQLAVINGAGGQVVARGTILEDPLKPSQQWVVTRPPTRAAVWVRDWPLVDGQVDAPFMWPVIERLAVVGRQGGVSDAPGAA